MNFMAFLMRPWVLKMKAMNIIPMVLADDLLIFATGTHAVIDTALALLLTHEYILDIRGIAKQRKLRPLHTAW